MQRMQAIMLALILGLPTLAIANPVPDFPFVIVTEEMKMKVKPDFVKVRFGVVSFDEDSEAAMVALTKTTAGVIALLKESRVALRQLESTQIDKVTKRARKDGAYNLHILGYEVAQGFTLTLHDLNAYPDFMNRLARLDGVHNIDALFGTTEEEKYKASLIAELSKKARSNADALAAAQSRTVKSVYGITTEANFGQAYAIFSLEYDPQSYALAMESGLYGADLVMSVPEFIEVGQRITSIYELE